MPACLSLLALAFVCTAEPPGAAPPAAGSALEAWQAGQQAMLDGNPNEAIQRFEESLRHDPQLARNHLSLAAAYLAQGREAQAAGQLAAYLTAQPDHLVVRAHYADLLLRLARPQEARQQFQRFIADVQEHDRLAREHLVHCHSRLMEIAQAEADPYAEHLHRGIGLYLLACRRDEAAADAGPLNAEALLCKAAAELTLARLQKPDEARPYWYLHEVWQHLGQKQPAGRCLRYAALMAPLSYLTPAEQRQMALACRQAERETLHK
jgi:tetratricopeptide (TPR) repeat protein